MQNNKTCPCEWAGFVIEWYISQGRKKRTRVAVRNSRSRFSSWLNYFVRIL